MQTRLFFIFFSALTVVMFTLGACGGQSTPTSASATATVAPATNAPSESTNNTEEMTETTEISEATEMTGSAEMTEAVTETVTEIMEMTEATSVVERPAWQLLPLINAQTGESFTLADFAGKTVYVEPFATWCSNCRQQMGNATAARANFGDDVVFIALSVETNIGNEVLVEYASRYGFDFIYAVMSPDLLRELVALHGQTITNPPATPHFIIRVDGSTTDLATGIEDVEGITTYIHANIQSSQS